MRQIQLKGTSDRAEFEGEGPTERPAVKNDAVFDCQFLRTQNNLGSPFNFHTLFTPDNPNKMLNCGN